MISNDYLVSVKALALLDVTLLQLLLLSASMQFAEALVLTFESRLLVKNLQYIANTIRFIRNHLYVRRFVHEEQSH